MGEGMRFFIQTDVAIIFNGMWTWRYNRKFQEAAMSNLVNTPHQMQPDVRELDTKLCIERRITEALSEEDRSQLQL